MKGLILSTGLAAGLGLLAFAPANAAPVAPAATLAAPSVMDAVDCRTVKKTVVRNGVRRTTTTRECDRYDRPRYVERRRHVERRRYWRDGRYYYGPPPRSGVTIGIGVR